MPTATIYRSYAVDFDNPVYAEEPPATETDYLSARNAAESKNVYENPGTALVPQQGTLATDEGFFVRRSAIYFDTSPLEGLNITNVVLRVYLYYSSSGAHCGNTIQNGQPTYPHEPAVAGDYSLSHYSGNGGQIPPGLGNGWYDIQLTEDGISWINKTGITKLIVRSNNDINAVVPTHSGEGYGLRNDSTYYSPKLLITYTPAGVTTEAASQVGIDHAKGNGTITGSNITERGFEVKLTFSGTLKEAINHSIAGFKGDFSYNIATGKYEGTLIKTVTEAGSFEEGAFVGDLGRFPIAVASDKLFAEETYEYRAYAIIDGETYYGDYVEFTTNSYPSGEGPDEDAVSPATPIIELIPEEEEEIPEFEWPEEIIPELEWPEIDIPPFEFDPDISFGRTFGAFLRRLDTKKDWKTLREKCIIYQENMNQFALTVNHNMLVLKYLINDIVEYINGDVYPSDLELMNSSQHLTPLYLEEISPNGFKDIINDFRLKDVTNVHELNQNFTKILQSLNSLYESDYTTEPISYDAIEYRDTQPTAKRMILQLEDMRRKSREVRRLVIRNIKRIFTYV